MSCYTGNVRHYKKGRKWRRIVPRKRKKTESHGWRSHKILTLYKELRIKKQQKIYD